MDSRRPSIELMLSLLSLSLSSARCFDKNVHLFDENEQPSCNRKILRDNVMHRNIEIHADVATVGRQTDRIECTWNANDDMAVRHGALLTQVGRQLLI